MKICNSCGAQRHVMGQWQGGDRNCDHFYTDVIPSRDCEAEIKMLLTTYPAAEIAAAVKSLCGAEVR